MGRVRVVVWVGVLAGVLAGVLVWASTADDGRQVWPVAAASTVGMDGQALAAVLDAIAASEVGVRRVVVVRQGKMVVSASAPPYTAADVVDVRSVTKSVVGLVVGIAVQEGAVRLDDRVLDVLGAEGVQFVNAEKRLLTVGDLLTMQAGMVTPDRVADLREYEQALGGLVRSADWTQTALDRPMAGLPGTVWRYDDGATQILVAVLEATTGEPVYAYAQRMLFGPLGIESAVWQVDGVGTTSGPVGLFLSAEDMARLGEVVRTGGLWRGQRVVDGGWIAAMTTAQVDASATDGFEGGGYGYLWWVGEGVIAAAGYGGQRIYVVREDELVVVFTGAVDRLSVGRLEGWLEEIRAAVGVGDAEGDAALAGAVMRLETSKSAPPSPMPPQAAAILDVPFVLGANPLRWEEITVRAGPDANTLVLLIKYGGAGVVGRLVGMDGVARVAMAEEERARLKVWPAGLVPRVGVRGEWVNGEAVLLLQYGVVESPEVWWVAVDFREVMVGEGVVVQMYERTQGVGVVVR